eukprot:1144350-Pelagomonas_calceolata.AAC.2
MSRGKWSWMKWAGPRSRSKTRLLTLPYCGGVLGLHTCVQNYNLDDLLDVMQNGAGTSPKPPPQPPGPSPSQQAARQPTPSAPTYQPKCVHA